MLFPRNPFKALNNLFSAHIKRMKKLSTLKMRILNLIEFSLNYFAEIFQKSGSEASELGNLRQVDGVRGTFESVYKVFN